MKILNNLELISSKIKLGDNVLELPKKDGVIATLGDLSNSEQDVVFGNLEAGAISASCGNFSGNVCAYHGKFESITAYCSLSASHIYIGDKPVATEEYVDTCISTLEGEVQDVVDELSAKISSVYKYVGSVESEEALKALDTTNLNNGDVYNVTETDENWALIKTETETKWDKLGSTIDLAPYALKTDVSGCIAAVEAKIPTDFYTTSQADEKFEKSGCASWALGAANDFASGCARAIENLFYCFSEEIEDKIPTDYLPAVKDGSGQFIINNGYNAVVFNGCVNIGEGLEDGETGATFRGETSFYGRVSISKDPRYSSDVTHKKYVDDAVKAVEDKIPTDYLPKVNGQTTLCANNDGFSIQWKDANNDISLASINCYGIEFFILPKVDDTPVSDIHLTPKKYVDDSISTLESVMTTDYATKVELQSTVDNGVLTEDIALTGGSLSGDQFSWTIAPSTGISKLLAIVTMDADGNIVTPTYKWDKTAKNVKVTVFSSTAVADSTYTTTITYKK